MNETGTYTYSKTNDIYSGAWKDGKKHGDGIYEYAKDGSVLRGQWVDGNLTTGKWVMKDFGVYEGSFESGKPIGKGQFVLKNGQTCPGTFVASPQAQAPEDPESSSSSLVMNNPVWQSEVLLKM